MKPPHRHSSRFLVVGLTALSALFLLWQQYGLVLTVGQSMQPTIPPHDLLLIQRRPFASSQPQRGAVVVVRYRGELLVKRIIGLPGERVEVKDGRVFIDSRPLAELHRILPGHLNIGSGKLLGGKFAVLGDNRAIPLPVHAVVSREQILGKVVLSASSIKRALGLPQVENWQLD